MCYCDKCEKEMNIITKSKHNTSNTHIHRKDYGIVVRKNEIMKQETDEVHDFLRDVIKDCS